MFSSRLRSRPLFLGLACAVALSACSEETVFVDPPKYNPPPDSVSNFVGYLKSSTKKTACGNCHVGTQSQWVESGHAQAWAGLQLAGAGVQASCYGCHGVSQNGNRITVAAGINFANDTTYHDVQCESCHGPGRAHIDDPNNSNVPLARANVTTGYAPASGVGVSTGLDLDASCASCHGQASHGISLAEEWQASGHGRIQTSPAGNTASGCNTCHDGKAFIRSLNGNVDPNYVERTNTTPGQQQYFPVTCTACHDPHGSANGKMLRLPIDQPDLTTNLCMRCHNRGARPSGSFTNGSRGAHSAQGPIVAGDGFGYIPAGFVFDAANPAATAHNSDRNPKLCAGCHVIGYSVTDGGVTFSYEGHEFLAIPCTQANGLPSSTQTCGYTTAERRFTDCASSGCHTSADAARSQFVALRTSIQASVNTIFQNLDGSVNPSAGNAATVTAADGGLLAEIFRQQQAGTIAATDAFLGTDNKVSPAEGALYNVYTLSETLYSHQDGSKGTHNPAFYKALLAANILELEARYPTLPRLAPAERQRLEQDLRSAGATYDPRAKVAMR